MYPNLKLSAIIAHLQTRWTALPEHRNLNLNQRYTLSDAALSALGVFFMQSPSFLAHQRVMHTRKGRSYVESLFGVVQIPSDTQIRSLLDPLPAALFQAEFAWVYAALEAAGVLERFRDVQGTHLVALDGVALSIIGLTGSPSLSMISADTFGIATACATSLKKETVFMSIECFLFIESDGEPLAGVDVYALCWTADTNCVSSTKPQRKHSPTPINTSAPPLRN